MKDIKRILILILDIWEKIYKRGKVILYNVFFINVIFQRRRNKNVNIFDVFNIVFAV